jgi:hypothetical protein
MMPAKLGFLHGAFSGEPGPQPRGRILVAWWTPLSRSARPAMFGSIAMKRILLAVELLLFVSTSFAQGLVNFGNGPTTQLSVSVPGGPAFPLQANSPGSFYFALLTSPTANGPFGFSGIYATNSANAGRIAPYTTSVPGWAPGETMFYEVVGWGSSLGQTFDPTWLAGDFLGKDGWFGVSSVASGVAGGGLPVPAPAWNLFGGTGLTGFHLNPEGSALVPEPSNFALAGLGAVLFLFRRRKLIDWLTRLISWRKRAEPGWCRATARSLCR